MNMKTVVPLGLAFVLAIMAAFVVKNVMAHRGGPVASNSNLVAVVVTKGDLEPGRALTKEDLVVAKVPAELAPGHVFSDPNQLVGRVATSPMSKGQTIMESLLAATGTGSGLQALIPPGMRALTIEVNEYSGVGGMLEPGCRVDLVSNLNDPKTHENVCRTVLQDVKIGAIGRNVTAQHPVEGQPLPPPSNSITLLLTPKQVQTLQLAAMTSRPWLVLRGSKDNQEVSLASTTLAELRNDPTEGSDPTPQVQPVTTTSTDTVPSPWTPVIDAQPEQPTTIRRTVTFIRNGVETTQTFTIPAPVVPHAERDSTVNTDITPIPAQ